MLACWRRITAPTLLVSGTDSHVPARMKKDPEDLVERKAAFRSLQEVELEDCGHMMHFDQPRELAKVIEHFIAAS
jgi:pimeloyl-ACP methyl ester carboxylesterase